jgi:hypothetical protein
MASWLPSEFVAALSMTPAPNDCAPDKRFPLLPKSAAVAVESFAQTRKWRWSAERAITPSPFWKSAGAREVRFVKEFEIGSQSAARDSLEEGWCKRTRSFPLASESNSTGRMKTWLGMGVRPGTGMRVLICSAEGSMETTRQRLRRRSGRQGRRRCRLGSR